MIGSILDLLVQFVVSVIGATQYVGIFFLMALESCGIPIPSEVIMPFSGFLVVQGTLSFWGITFAGAFGNLIGSLVAYWIGLKGGRPLIEKWGKYILISKHDLDIADAWFTKRGKSTVFVGRLLPVVRTYISFPAGIAHMNVMTFSWYTFFGALPWSALFAWLGITLGEHWDAIRDVMHRFDLVIAAIILLAIIAYVWRHIRQAT